MGKKPSKTRLPVEPDEVLPAPKNKGGRPPKLNPTEDTISQIETLAGVQCTVEEAAAILGVDKKTFIEFKKKYPQVQQAWDSGREMGKASLRRMQFALARKSAAMAIFLGKNILGQKDQAPQPIAIAQVAVQQNNSAEVKINDKMTPEEAAACYAQTLLGKVG